MQLQHHGQRQISCFSKLESILFPKRRKHKQAIVPVLTWPLSAGFQKTNTTSKKFGLLLKTTSKKILRESLKWMAAKEKLYFFWLTLTNPVYYCILKKGLSSSLQATSTSSTMKFPVNDHYNTKVILIVVFLFMVVERRQITMTNKQWRVKCVDVMMMRYLNCKQFRLRIQICKIKQFIKTKQNKKKKRIWYTQRTTGGFVVIRTLKLVCHI